MAHPLSTDVLEALDRAAQRLPDLAVVNAPDCGGFAWVSDPASTTIYVRAADPCTWSANMLDALADLTARSGTQDAPRPTLTLLQGGGQGDGHQPARTGS